MGTPRLEPYELLSPMPAGAHSERGPGVNMASQHRRVCAFVRILIAVFTRVLSHQQYSRVWGLGTCDVVGLERVNLGRPPLKLMQKSAGK